MLRDTGNCPACSEVQIVPCRGTFEREGRARGLLSSTLKSDFKLAISNGFRSRRVSVLRCTRTGLFILGIGSGSSNRVSVDPELEIEPERGREGLVPMRLVELRVAQSLGPKRPRNGRVPGRFCT